MKFSEDLIRTRGKKYKLTQHHCYYDFGLGKSIFTNRIIPVWNSLSDQVVSSDTVNTFKRRLDKYWSDQDILCDYKADSHGIGNRSTVI